MKYITDISGEKFNNSIVTLGKFDGNHIGHRFLFNTAIELKEELNSKKDAEEKYRVVIFTFNVHTSRILHNGEMQTILTRNERLIQTYENGIDFVIEFPFNDETRNMLPEEFVKNILVGELDTKAVVVGEDFRFGKDRRGNVDLLEELGEKYGFAVKALKKIKYKPKDKGTEVEVSSTLIKEELAKGNLEDANKMLGAPFSITQEVQSGKHFGNTIGFPTLNFAAPADKILPPDGVYATKTIIEGKEYLSITNVGNRPTFDDGEERTVETNVLDFSENVYGKTAEVRFYKYIRPEEKFNSLDELKREIVENVKEVRRYFR